MFCMFLSVNFVWSVNEVDISVSHMFFICILLIYFQKPKSYTAAEATLNINPYIKIDSDINKVCPATENTYSDEFYTKQDVIVTALDNVEARRYIDR